MFNLDRINDFEKEGRRLVEGWKLRAIESRVKFLKEHKKLIDSKRKGTSRQPESVRQWEQQ